jgi:hypothetical protein
MPIDNGKDKGVMTNAEETRELRRWLREDAKRNSGQVEALHKKIDDGNRDLRRQIEECNKENQQDHKDLDHKISKIGSDGKVTAAKLLGLAGLVSILVTVITGHYLG